MQLFKKIVFLALTLFLLVQCQSSKTAALWQDHNTEAYYYIWHTGMAPAGTGADFFLSFNLQDPTLKVDSFIVNNIALNAEIIKEDDQILISGKHYTPPNFEKEESEIPEFYKSENYAGRIRITVKGESFWIEIKTFEKRQTTNMHL